MARTKGKVYTRGLDYYDRLIPSLLKPAASKSRKLATSVTLTANDLSALADYIAAGIVMLRISRPHRAVSKFKAAMTRLGLSTTRGL